MTTRIATALAEGSAENVVASLTASAEATLGDKKGSTSLFAVAGDYKVFAGIGTGLGESPVEATRERAAAQGIDVDALEGGKEGGYLLPYEAGLAAGRDAFKTRAPLSRGDDGSVSFACGIPEGSVIRLTESSAEQQIESAREAARSAAAQLAGTKPAGAIVFDCICRNWILGDDFSCTVRGISEELGGPRLAGFETYGEIALDVGDRSGFHDTTSVVLAFPET